MTFIFFMKSSKRKEGNQYKLHLIQNYRLKKIRKKKNCTLNLNISEFFSNKKITEFR